jgi:crotonobetainyl-CoA:carnitine CoA-transferase CaiB-like acyl-CoA transferase
MGALEGVRVLDLTRLLPGPFASLVLADLGATVDKVEDADQGDYLRHLPPQIGGSNVAFGMLNRGKRSLVLDLKRPEGRAAFERLLPTYDVLFEQFRPGVLARLGFPVEELRAKHPRLIVCSLTGYGQTGPLAQRSGHDLNYVARSGILGHQGDERGPQVPGFQTADVSGGMWSVIGILAALLERARTGQGAHVDVAMSEGTVPFNVIGLAASMVGQAPARGGDQLTGGIAPYGVYRTSDDQLMTIAALEPKFWLKFSGLFGLSAQMSDLVPGPHQAELKASVAAIFRDKDAATWAEVATANDLPIERVLAPGDIPHDPHLAARGVLFTRESPGGPVPQFRTPVSPESVKTARLAGRAGEDSRSILAEAGLSSTEIDALVASGAVRE